METNEKTVSGEYEGNSSKKKNNKGIMIGIIIAVVIALAVAIGLGIYNSPENRMSRQLDLGQKYLEEQNYEQAVVAFNEVIEIDDRCLEAYLGGMEAYAMLGDAENRKVLCEKALGVVREFSAEEIEADKEDVTLLYLAAKTVYAGDDEKILEILQEGYDLTGDERLEAKIKEAEKRLIKQKREEFTLDQRNQLAAIRGCMIDGFCYLTYEQIEKEVSPYIELLEKYKEVYPDDVYGWADLEIFYYMIGEYEACLDIRKQLYEITGSEWYSEERVWNNGEDNVTTEDKFGRIVKSFNYADDDWPVDTWDENEYGENGRLITRRVHNSSGHSNGGYTNYIDSIFTYEYDNDGRVEKMTMEDYHVGSEAVCSYSITTYSYENLEQGYYTAHDYSTGSICSGDGGWIHECDYDITIEKNGMITYGKPYNEYRSE